MKYPDNGGDGQLVEALNQVRATPSAYAFEQGSRQCSTRCSLHYYFVAQEIYKWASSAHACYQQLREELRFSEMMFRFQRLLEIQASACEKLSQSILLCRHYQHDLLFIGLFLVEVFLGALHHLLSNLRSINAHLVTIESE